MQYKGRVLGIVIMQWGAPNRRDSASSAGGLCQITETRRGSSVLHDALLSDVSAALPTFSLAWVPLRLQL